MSGADAVQLEKSLTDESMGGSFVDKQFLYVNDQNNGNYSGTITIDSTTLSNSGSYIGWSEAFLLIPTVLQLYQSAGLTASTRVDFAMAMKNAYWHLIHSLSVDFNNSSVVQQTSFLNVFSSFKNLTSWSQDDLKNWGSSTGFYPDTHDSWLFNDAVNSATNFLSGSGTGLCNNRLVKTFSNATAFGDVTVLTGGTISATEVTSLSDSVQGCANAGLLTRMKWLNFDWTQNAAVATAPTASAGKALVLASTASQLGNLFKSYVQSTTNNRAVVFPAIIRLKDVCDFFEKMPLMKGATFRLQIATNQCLCQVVAVPAEVETSGAVTTAPSLQLSAPPVILGGGGTCPFMISSNDLGQGYQPLVPVDNAAAAGSVAAAFACSIVRTQFRNQISAMADISAPISSVRLYAPAYTMSPQAEAAYLSQQSTKKIVYEDIFQYQFNAIGTSWNYLVTNGLPNLKSILICPFLNASSNGTVGGAGNYAGGVTTSTLLSPFASSGGTPDPVAFTNFQVQISGKNLFNDQKQYDYQEFLEQLVSSNQLNGNLTTGMASGLIGADEFANLYRYYYADASRGLPSEAGVSRSIQISGTTLTAKSVNLMVFASFARTIVIDLRTGQRIE